MLLYVSSTPSSSSSSPPHPLTHRPYTTTTQSPNQHILNPHPQPTLPLTSPPQVPIIALGCCAVLLVPKAQAGPVVALRLVMFTGLAVPGLAAIIHGRVIKVKAGARKAPISLWWIITTGVLNAAGAVVYAAKVCEIFGF